MSSPKKVLVIDCGANHVAAGFFSVGSHGPVLSDFETETIGGDYTSEQEWVDAVYMGVRAISKRRKLAGPAYLVAPGHLLLMKFLKIPHVGKGKRDQIVKFEAQQNIPYPLPEVVWDYETILDDGAEFEVALVAIKIEIVQALCDRLATVGVEAEIIDPSSMAQYNAFAHSYPEFQQGALLVNIGAKSSDLLFIDTGGFFVRNVPIAGNTLTQAIAEELKISYDQAEDLKIRTFAAEVDGISEEVLQAVQRSTEAFLRRFSMELTRSIVNFRRQSGAEQVGTVYLTGGGAIVPGIVEHLGEKLKIHVEWYDSLRNVTVGSKLSQEKIENHTLQLGSLVGAALRAQPGTRTHFNLLPPALAKQVEFKHKRTYLVAAAATLAVAGFIPAIIYQTQAQTFELQANELEMELVPLRQLDTQIRNNLRRAEEIRGRITSFEKLARTRGNWIVFLRDLQQRLVQIEDVWLDELAIVGPQQPQQQERRAGGILGGPAAPAAATDGSALRLNLSGRLLDRENPTSRVSPHSQQRVNALLASFADSEFVSKVENERFNADEPGILRFEFTLVLDSSRGL
jgi:type IV pilus assembly protein PilM